jgi:hypothetical protein
MHEPEQMSKKKIEIRGVLAWDKVEAFIDSLSLKRLGMEEGLMSIHKFLQTHYPGFDSTFVLDLDLVQFQLGFVGWVKLRLTQSPLDANIQSLYFGLFQSNDPAIAEGEESVTILYISGSDQTPDNDPEDWAVDPAYFPDGRYVVVPEYIGIYTELAKYENTMEVEQIIINGMTNLILQNSLNEIGTLTGRAGIYVGSGFDGGTCFVVGKTSLQKT